MDRLSHLIFVFSVADNRLGPEGAKILADMLSVSTSMTSLNLADNALCGLSPRTNAWGKVIGKRGKYDSTGIKAIADALNVSTSMTSLK